MSFLEQLDQQLAVAGVPRARRARIAAEFADHLRENPNAELGRPEDLARQFAEELGSWTLRAAAFRTFAALAFAGCALLVMFVAVGRVRALTLYGGQHHAMPAWVSPLLLAAALAAQVALAAGGLALLRAWRLRRDAVIRAADARILARRAALGLFSGVIALSALPATAIAFPHAIGSTWRLAAWPVTVLALLALLSALPQLLRGLRLRPRGSGPAGDLRDDLEVVVPWAPSPRATAMLLSATIIVAFTVLGLLTDDPYDGMLRGMADGLACLVGYALLGDYLGLRDSATD